MAQVTGFPDYGRLAVQSAEVLATVAAAFSANPATGILDCTGYGYLDIYVNYGLVTSYAKIVVIWYLDPAGAIIIGQNSMLPVPGFETIKQWPVRSRYCNVFAVFESGVNTEIAKYNVFGNNAYMPNIRMDNNGYPACRLAASIAAAGNAIAPLLQTYEGDAMISLQCASSALWRLELQYYQYDVATWNMIASFYGATQGNAVVSKVRLPPCPVRIEAFNLDSAAAHFTYASLVI